MQLRFCEFHSGNAQGADFEAFLHFSRKLDKGEADGAINVSYRRLRPHEILRRLRAQGLTARQLAATRARLREKFESWKRRPNRHSPKPK
ncbi:MAG TPA: hypothetical protein HA252_01840 [Candidatus Diapherotrites archaeon]|uniref:Uncharacterized protein n=1 Tax=Candidatus Iainarchaeum sp. TaxID=3101447 RepID=A0A7J4JI91_9ARCH|nr:hypothetical protein [Candidatus Diapherotrites archaeon]HIH16125.1 hypothetical protein [Candidatus Diapherotrites archaeon]